MPLMNLPWMQALRAPGGAKRAPTAVCALEWQPTGLLALRAESSSSQALNQHAPEQLQAHHQVLEPSERRAALTQLARKGWFDRARVVLLLGHRQRQMNVVARPPVPELELREAARWQLQGMLEHPLPEALLDVLPLWSNEASARQQLMVFSIHRPVLFEALAPFADERVPVHAVSVVDVAQRNLIPLAAAAVLRPGQPLAALSVRDGALLFTISQGEELWVSRAFDVPALSSPDALEPEALVQLADRVGLQLQRLIDALERRASAPTHLLLLEHPHHMEALRQIGELTGLRLHSSSAWTAWGEAAAIVQATEHAPECAHLLGTVLGQARALVPAIAPPAPAASPALGQESAAFA